mmetsp:Transcript_24101/g.48184  ORF Transcript_24101/g.48184 Transcript_24101/m.48184 type:complete len:200 (-) Transcript_24101:325-924(-)
MPLSSRPGMGKLFGTVEPIARTTASKSVRDSRAFSPISAPHSKVIPSASIRRMRRATVSLSSFMLGMPYVSKPPGFSDRSKTVTRWPDLLSWSADARPAGPEPMTATFLPVRTCGGCARTHPSAHARSMMVCSMFLMVTALSTRPATHEPSHGAGQTRPVNSGKLLVDERLVYAAFHCSVNTRLLKSGMRLLIGQPVCV